MGTAATKQCFESILCKNKVKPLNRTSSSAKASCISDTNSKTEQTASTALPTVGEVIDYDLGTLQQPLQRIAWDEPKEFISEAVTTLSEKGQEMVVEEIVNPIKETVSSKWKLLNLESKRNVSTAEAPATPWLLHPDSCHEINKD